MEDKPTGDSIEFGIPFMYGRMTFVARYSEWWRDGRGYIQVGGPEEELGASTVEFSNPVDRVLCDDESIEEPNVAVINRNFPFLMNRIDTAKGRG